MNLHGLARGVIAVVNPTVPATVRVSIGNAAQADGARVPSYATPGQIIGSIAGDVLTVTAQAAGRTMVGQQLADIGGLVLPGTMITDTIVPFGGAAAGSYRVNNSQTVATEAMTTSFVLGAQVQSLTFRDITQIDGLNLQGTRRGIYLFGEIDGLVRPDNKGGDLITLPDGTTWLVAMVLEQWPDWCKVAVTRQT